MEQIYYDIILALQQQEEHARALAKRLKTNHMTIQRKLKELEEDNIVDYKQQGKNKTYHLKDNIEARTATKMAELKKMLRTIKEQPRIRKIAEKIEQENTPLALLFGSYAKGTQTTTSDIDIYIETNDKRTKEKLELTDSKISIKIGTFNKDNELGKEIIRHHTILKGVERYHEIIHH